MTDHDHDTAIDLAYKRGNEECVQILKDYGAEISSRNHHEIVEQAYEHVDSDYDEEEDVDSFDLCVNTSGSQKQIPTALASPQSSSPPEAQAHDAYAASRRAFISNLKLGSRYYF